MFAFNTINQKEDITLFEKIPKSWKLKYPVDICYAGKEEFRLVERKPKTNITAQELSNKGGSWLGRVRSWIQWNCTNGDEVTWGSFDHLKNKPFTVKDLELLAADIAAAAINEYCNKRD